VAIWATNGKLVYLAYATAGIAYVLAGRCHGDDPEFGDEHEKPSPSDWRTQLAPLAFHPLSGWLA
jgi:hypothetical protein